MTGKRPPSPGLIPNPFIKKRNLEWTLDSVSPTQPPTTADIESGSATVGDHLAHFKNHLSKHIVSPTSLSIFDYASLYTANAGSRQGAHFVIHQHDHPVVGTHYDLRLQINETSSVSWAIMYGLPGDPNSTRLNRNATETRIHCLWVRERPFFLIHRLTFISEPSYRDSIKLNWLASHMGYRNIQYPASQKQALAIRRSSITAFFARVIPYINTTSSSKRCFPKSKDSCPASRISPTRSLCLEPSIDQIRRRSWPSEKWKNTSQAKTSWDASPDAT